MIFLPIFFSLAITKNTKDKWWFPNFRCRSHKGTAKAFLLLVGWILPLIIRQHHLFSHTQDMPSSHINYLNNSPIIIIYKCVPFEDLSLQQQHIDQASQQPYQVPSFLLPSVTTIISTWKEYQGRCSIWYFNNLVYIKILYQVIIWKQIQWKMKIGITFSSKFTC